MTKSYEFCYYGLMQAVGLAARYFDSLTALCNSITGKEQ